MNIESYQVMCSSWRFVQLKQMLQARGTFYLSIELFNVYSFFGLFQFPGGQITVQSYAARYMATNWTAAATLGMTGLHLTYYHKQTENIQFGVEFESNLNIGEVSVFPFYFLFL